MVREESENHNKHNMCSGCFLLMYQIYFYDMTFHIYYCNPLEDPNTGLWCQIFIQTKGKHQLLLLISCLAGNINQ